MGKKNKKIPTQPGTRPQFSDLIEKQAHLFLLTILFIALILRVIALLSLKESIYFDFLLWDERLYHNWALKIANGTFQSSSVYEMAPLPAYFMAFIYRLLSPDVIYIRIANIIFGVLTCLLIYLIGKEIANRTVGLLACFIASLYELFIFYSIVPLKTALSVFLFASACYFLVAITNRNSVIKALLLGIAIGLANNVRPNCGVLIPLIPLLMILLIYRGRSTLRVLSASLICYVAGLSIAMSPFIIRNHLMAGEFAPSASQSGFNLYMSNNLQYSYPLPFASTSPAEMGIHFTIEASRRAGKKLSSQEASSYWTREVIKTAFEQPSALIWKKCKSAARLFNWFEDGDHYQIGFLSNFVKFFKLPFFSFWLILPFGMAGMIINSFRSRKSLTLSAIFIVYASTLVLFFTNDRVRLPLLVILIPFCVMGINNLGSCIKRGELRGIPIYSAMVIAFFIIEFLPVSDTKDVTAHLNTYAIILDSKGLENEAIQYWEESSRLEKHFSPFANLALAEKYHKKGNIQKATYYLDKIADHSFAAAHKYRLLGDIMVGQRQIEKAIAAYEKSLHINSGQRRTRSKLAELYSRTDKQKASEEYDKLKYISSFYDLYGSKRKGRSP